MKRTTGVPPSSAGKDAEQSLKQGDESGDTARIVAATENSAGTISFDELGQPRWTWVTELGDGTTDSEDTFDYLKALDTDALSIADDSGAFRGGGGAQKESGYNPYDTARIKIRGKFPRR